MLRYLGLLLSPDQTQATFDQFDEDGSGTIEFNEFLILLHQKVSLLLKGVPLRKGLLKRGVAIIKGQAPIQGFALQDFPDTF